MKVFMELLMDLDGGVLTDREIRDEMNTFIMAGHDTSANVTVFAFILIGSYPRVQAKIYEEQVFQSSRNTLHTFVNQSSIGNFVSL